MKKILFAVVVIAALMFCTTSCEKNKKKCLKVTVTYQQDGETKQASEYRWATHEESAATDFAGTILRALGIDPTDVKVVKTETVTEENYKTEADCLALNPAK